MGTTFMLLLGALVVYLGVYGYRSVRKTSDHDDSKMMYILITLVGGMLYAYSVYTIWVFNPLLAVGVTSVIIIFGFAILPLKRKLVNYQQLSEKR
jgi:hypothetical protein